MNVKNGFSTLNRLLGKKNKGNNQLSKSTTNLSTTSSLSQPHHIVVDQSINSSQNHLEQQNKITPLPIATTNAPFEQTFRITVLLPKGQLFVARLGAKIKLQKLLEIVCENKQLDQDKYEFRHPVDSSQVFSCELTIGAVGLNEIRLCHKSEAYNNFNADDIIKLRHTSRDSLSSSEFSSRNSKHTLKTASPYSSTNSLNSIDSTGMNSTSRGHMVSMPPLSNTMRSFLPNNNNNNNNSSNKSNGFQTPVAPARKKRIAPRPPSQNSIPEKEPINDFDNNNINIQQECKKILPKREFYVSSPNLSQTLDLNSSSIRTVDFHKSNVSVDCNGNNTSNGQIKSVIINKSPYSTVNIPNGKLIENNLANESHDYSIQSKINPVKSRLISISSINETINHNIENDERSDDSRRSSSSTMKDSTETLKFPEPVPRKRIVTGKKQAPAPPPRTQSLPVALPRNSNDQETIKTNENVEEYVKPKLNGSLAKNEICKTDESPKHPNQCEIAEQEKPNVININGQPTAPPSAPKTPPSAPKTPNEEATSLRREVSLTEFDLKNSSSLTFESSSDEEEQIKVYNLKLGKTIVKPLVEHKTYDDLSTLTSLNHETEINNKAITANSTQNDSLCPESPSWSYPIPAPPPNFADETTNQKIELCKKESSSSSTESSNISELSDIGKGSEFTTLENRNSVESSDTIITSDIEDGYRGNKDNNDCPIPVNNELEKKNIEIVEKENFSSNQKNVITELNNVLSENKIDLINSRSDENEEIQSPKPGTTLSNFKIQSYNSNNEPVIPAENALLEKEENKEKNILSDQVFDYDQEHQQHEIEEFLKKEMQENEKNLSITLKHKEEMILGKENKISVVFNNEIDETMLAKSFSDKSEEKVNNSITLKTPEEERLFKKRSNSSTNNISNGTPQVFKSKVNITRSDSFHSTRYPNSIFAINDGMSIRSSSYISLSSAQINMDNSKSNLNRPFIETNRRKSSSELSIGESPSLQSLIVMKSILNSHKNNFKTDEKYDSKMKILTPSSVYDDSDNSKENSPKNKILNQEISNTERKCKDDENQTEKKWKYQGPPSINLTSWDERPKIQVSIKNDGDYKFGVGGGGIGGASTSVTTFPRVYHKSVNSSEQPQLQQHQLRHHQQQGEITSTKINPVRVINEQPKVPYVCSVEYKKPITATTTTTTATQHVDSTGESNSIVYIRPLNGTSTAKPATTAPKTMTLGRIPKMITRSTSFAPTVKGFRNTTYITTSPKTTTDNAYHSLQTNSDTNDVDKRMSLPPQNQINLQTWKSTANTVGRSNSIITYSSKSSTLPNHNKINTTTTYINNSQNDSSDDIRNVTSKNGVEENPFSKIILRKTGLKEKILSQSQENYKPSIIKIEDSNCAKLKMKLTTTVNPQQINGNPNMNLTSKTLLPPTPPPPPPVIRSVVTKQNGKIKNCHNNCALDARSELLSAIRNFNREALKRS